MYYSHPCSYCDKIFYTFQNSKVSASRVLYAGIKQHLIDWDEDHKEYKFDDGPEVDADEVYYAMAESNDPPSYGYELS